jgi:hypothetical protein
VKDGGSKLTSEQKRLERQVEFVQYSLYALTMSCCVLILALEHYKVLSRRSELVIFIAIWIFGSVGLRALAKLKQSVLASCGYETKTSEILIEGTKS